MFLKKSKRFPLLLKRFLLVFHFKTLTRLHSSTWETEGFKGLVAYAIYNYTSYESENLFLLIRFFLGGLVVLLEDEQNLGVGIFFCTKNMLSIQYPYA